MQSTSINLTPTYQQVTTQSAFIIQNVNDALVEVVFKDTAPSETDKGIIIKHTDIIPSTLVTGIAYARSASNGTIVVVE